MENYPIYVKKSDLREAKKCKTPTSLARNLCQFVFTPDARLACSVSGKPATCKSTEIIRRSPLNKDGVNAIIGELNASFVVVLIVSSAL